MKPLVLTIDSGNSATKVAVFRVDGTRVAVRTAPTPRLERGPGRIERDPEAYWAAVAAAVREAVAAEGVLARDIAAIGIAAQGDGLHLVDAEGRTIGTSILSQDTRATAIVDAWAQDGTLDELRRQTGQIPFPGSPAPLLRWVQDNEPERLHGARWLLAPKDWLRLRMTGEVGTDRTDAAASFADADTQRYSTATLAATGLERFASLLPPILEPAAVAGTLTTAAAAELDLVPGIPVVAGLHDVAAAIVGAVGLTPGKLCAIAGTFGVNVVLAEAPVRSAVLNTRSGPTAGLWSVRRTARASVGNLHWVARVTGAAADHQALTQAAVLRTLATEPESDPPIYVPFLFGGNAGQPNGAAFLGLRSWHGRDALMRAVLEGVTFNHRLDAELIEDEIPLSDIYLVGGAAANPRWRQLFADAFGRPVTVLAHGDAGSRGVAICAAVGAGAFPDLATAARELAPQTVVVTPGPASVRLERQYRTYRDAVAVVTEFDAARLPAPLISEGG